MLIIEPTQEELSSGALTQANVDAAVKAFDEDGYMAILNAVPEEICDTLYDKMCEDGERVKAEFGHYMGLVPPPMQPYLFKELLLNDLASSVEFVDPPIQYLPTKPAETAAPTRPGMQDVEKLLSYEGGMTFDEIRAALPGPLKTSELRDHIKALSKGGLIRREGSGRASRWRRHHVKP